MVSITRGEGRIRYCVYSRTGLSSGNQVYVRILARKHPTGAEHERLAVIDRSHLVGVALGMEPADCVLRGGRVVGVDTRETFTADVVIAGGRVAALARTGNYRIDEMTEVIDLDGRHVCPGLIDPHMHIESSNLTVGELARAIVPRGVLVLIADPHEIANVLGMAGIEFLLGQAFGLPLDVLLRVPGRVPALPAHLETSGYEVDLEATLALLDRSDAVCIGGDINPALLLKADAGQLARIEAAIERGKTVGGQLPGFTGPELDASVACGLEDTHVAESVDEVIEQLRRGLRVLLTPRIDRLSAADWPELAATLHRQGIDTRHLVLCTDDVHPNLLRREGHLDHRVRLAIESGFAPIEAVQMATQNSAELMRLDRDRGSVNPGKLADLVVVDDLRSFDVSMVLHHGQVVVRDRRLSVEIETASSPGWVMDTVRLPGEVTADNLAVQVDFDGPVSVNVVEFGGPKTLRRADLVAVGGVVQPDSVQDVAGLAVLERHKGTGAVGRGFVVGLGIKGGAVASTVNHDSHNIFVVGDNHRAMAVAVNALAGVGGGYCAVVGTEVRAIAPLPIAGLLSEEPLEALADAINAVERVLLDDLGSSITSHPLYALNFLCLPNIPEVGMTDQGIVATASLSIVPTVVESASG